MGDIWNRLSEGQKRLISWLALAAVIGAGILAIKPAVPQQAAVSLPIKGQDPQPIAAAADWERQLAAMLNKMLGSGETQVFLTFERGPKLVVAHDITEEERQSADGGAEWRRTSSPVILRNEGERREMPLVLEEIEPAVRGVLVVVDDQYQPQLRLEIAQAVATVLQVPMYRIEVLFKQ